MSGGAAKFGFNIQWGMELAADEINALGGANVAGKKYKVRIVSMDDRFQAALAVNNAKRLVHAEGAKMVYNPNTGGIFALMAINEKEKFIVGAYTTTQDVVTSGNKLHLQRPAADESLRSRLHRKGLGPRLEELRHDARRLRVREDLGQASSRKPGRQRAAPSPPSSPSIS